MKKTYHLLLLMLMVSAVANAQAGWVTKKLDESLSVKFPVEPEIVTKNGINSYLSKGKDSVKYSSTIVDYKVVAHLDSATLAPVKDRQEFAGQLVKGIASAKKNYTFGDVTIGKWNTYTTYNVYATDNTTKGTLRLFMILIGSKMYMLSCLVPANLVTKNNEMFLASVELVKK